MSSKNIDLSRSNAHFWKNISELSQDKKRFALKGGGGVHPDYFVKLDFEIAVDQQTRAHDRTFEGVPDSGRPRDSHAHIWSICGPILPNDLIMLKTMISDALPVATSLLNTCI